MEILEEFFDRQKKKMYYEENSVPKRAPRSQKMTLEENIMKNWKEALMEDSAEHAGEQGIYTLQLLTRQLDIPQITKDYYEIAETESLELIGQKTTERRGRLTMRSNLNDNVFEKIVKNTETALGSLMDLGEIDPTKEVHNIYQAFHRKELTHISQENKISYHIFKDICEILPYCQHPGIGIKMLRMVYQNTKLKEISFKDPNPNIPMFYAFHMCRTMQEHLALNQSALVSIIHGTFPKDKTIQCFLTYLNDKILLHPLEHYNTLKNKIIYERGK